MNPFIVTNDPRDISLILLDEVEGVWWKRNHDPALASLNAAIAAFNEDQLAIDIIMKRDRRAGFF